MWLDLLPLGVVLYFAAAGVMSGTLVSFLRIFSLVGAYVAAFALGPVLGPIVAVSLGTTAFISTQIARALLFFAVFFACGLAIWMVKRSRTRESPPRTSLDRTGGALIGMVQGLALALLIGVLASWVGVGQKRGGLTGIPSGGARIAAISSAVLDKTADLMLDSEARSARLAMHFAAHPDEAVRDFESLVKSPALTKLNGDKLFWSYLEQGAIDQALNRGSFLEITYDKELRGDLLKLGMISDASAENPTQFRAEARALFTELSPRIRILRQDPVMQELAADPAILEAVRDGNTFALLTDARVQDLVSRVIEARPDSAAEAEPS